MVSFGGESGKLFSPQRLTRSFAGIIPGLLCGKIVTNHGWQSTVTTRGGIFGGGRLQQAGQQLLSGGSILHPVCCAAESWQKPHIWRRAFPRSIVIVKRYSPEGIFRDTKRYLS